MFGVERRAFRSRRFYAVAGASALLVVVGAVGLHIATASDNSSLLTSVPADLYQQAGVTLALPGSGEQASISKEDAVNAVEWRWPGTSVREVKLLDVDAQSPGGPIRCLCWVVSSMSPGGITVHGVYSPPGPEGDAAREYKKELGARLNATGYHLDFVDAKTGEWLAATEGGRP
jgi:hypothetical protein